MPEKDKQQRYQMPYQTIPLPSGIIQAHRLRQNTTKETVTEYPEIPLTLPPTDHFPSYGETLLIFFAVSLSR